MLTNKLYRIFSINKNSVVFLSKSVIKSFFILAILSIIVVAWSNFGKFEDAFNYLKVHDYGLVYMSIGRILLVISLTAFLWRAILVLKYRPVKACRDEQLPSCTVIVPAYNEGHTVSQTLHSIVQSDYPTEKLQIIAIDDGSLDDTWAWIEKTAKTSSRLIKTLRLPKNCGKRKALYEGFMQSNGEILVTIDSDSVIEPQTIRCLVSPFCYDKNIGAVAGCVHVLNRYKGIIPRMLDVSFTYSFEFLRASQSVVNTVFCAPGALSAYRREPLMNVLENWVNQTFLGRPSKIGEDRAITNAILRSGYHVTFQSNAVVYTNVPVCYKNLCKMFLRWARSNIRETFVMASFIFRKFRQTPATGARINFLLNVIYLTVPQIFLAGLAWSVLWHPFIFVPHIMFCASVSGCVPAAFYALRRYDSNALWAIPYNMFCIFALSWIIPYAIFTVGNNGWLTREIKEKEIAL